ncbi:MAG TPA: transposase [Lamprocystis sp. (in: g-proteobacteria)]|nr:transposase [Lamprocystis sp. (in: g-proteobacteria)]
MSVPDFSTQTELFSTAGLSGSLFAPADRYRLFGKRVYPVLAGARPTLEKCYCLENGRTALEPVLMLGVSLLQELDGVPDRQAVELLRYHAGWNFALNRQLGDALFHPSSLVNFRQRLAEHQQSALVFQSVWHALEQAGFVSRQSRQRLDSTQMFGRVAKMSRLDCVRESLRLALQELEGVTPREARPVFWSVLWERYVESQVDYRASAESLGRKLREAGGDAWQVLEWVRGAAPAPWAGGPQVALLRRVFGEQFEVVAGQPAPRAQEPSPGGAEAAEATSTVSPPAPPPAAPAVGEPAPGEIAPGAASVTIQPEGPVPGGEAGPRIEPKGQGQLRSDRVQNPHEPEATYAVKGQGAQKKEHVGYKVQVAETVSEAVLAPGEPTRNFLAGVVTQAAHESDERGAERMAVAQVAMGIGPPPVLYVDGAYVSAEKLVEAQAQGRELIGPAQPAPRKEGRFSTEDFAVEGEARRATCPAGQLSTQCSRLEEAATGKVSYRFEWSTHCHPCPLRAQCLGQDQPHRTLVVGAYHSALQARRQEQRTDAFQQRMKHRNAIEGTQSELVRGHGLRRARYRGLGKVALQNYFIGAACNVKRWIRREVWQLQQAASALAGRAAGTAAN